MADLKISQLTGAATPLDGTELAPLVQSGVTKNVSVANITAGRAVSAASVTASTGNFIVGTLGKGVDFSVTGEGSGTMTSELLNDYEEGTWTPNQGEGLTVVGAFSSSGTYTKVGRIVYVRGNLVGATSIACSSLGRLCSNLPFSAPVVDSPGGLAVNSSLTASNTLDVTGVSVYSIGAIAATFAIRFSITYNT